MIKPMLGLYQTVLTVVSFANPIRYCRLLYPIQHDTMMLTCVVYLLLFCNSAVELDCVCYREYKL